MKEDISKNQSTTRYGGGVDSSTAALLLQEGYEVLVLQCNYMTTVTMTQ